MIALLVREDYLLWIHLFDMMMRGILRTFLGIRRRVISLHYFSMHVKTSDKALQQTRPC